MQQKHKDQLESLIDKYGAQSVVEAVAEILSEKADHISSNNDRDSDIQLYELASRRLNECADVVGQLVGE